MDKKIIGFFDHRSQAEQAVNDLIMAGYNRSNIDVVTADDEVPVTDLPDQSSQSNNSSFMDRIKNFFSDSSSWGLSEDTAGYYAEGVRRGGYLVNLVADEERAEEAATMLSQAGAVDIEGRAEFYQQSGYQSYDFGAAPYEAEDRQRFSQDYSMWEQNRSSQPTVEAVLPVIEENLKVGKRTVERGGVRVLSRVTERPVEEQVTLREEHVDVERHAVNRKLDSNDLDAFREGEINLTETAEEAVIEKEARVVEEVSVRKNVDEHTETIHDTVRRKDVDIERLPPQER